MGDILEEQRHKLEDNLLVDGGISCTPYFPILVSPEQYVIKFQWDTAKYPTKLPLQNLHDVLSEAK